MGTASRSGWSEGGSDADEVERRALEELDVVLGVLAGVEDQGEPPSRLADLVGAEFREAGGQLVDHLGELGDIGLVAGIGVGDQRDAAVDGNDQAKADQAQIGPFLLGVAPLGDRGAVVGGVDVGGEVRHVEHQARYLDLELVDDMGHDAPLDLSQLLGR